ncbi:ABC transporter ATP-binding protein [Paenibacillus alginolyticus]|uniref:ABC transporter ATP-binding protein n=1 Tax=Paenibacillus alginolyticus TaxID=59839 RepID=UPI000409B261|nr:ABC transporter ATP-binding protein [Paenibacillus alginolyticus]MCY9664842.1 ABC transporter ATP-binding protein [Paenibacillus alginolyticus]
MNNKFAISLDHISKIYKLYNKPTDRLKEAINLFGRKYHNVFYAINELSMEINKNESVGIIGKNGSGKSTLLKMITGLLTPTSGSIIVNGKVSALLELGAGFNPEYTGLENIYLNGAIMGFTKEQIDEKLETILSFADIGDFIYQPVKVYSSGMFVRLAFAVSINVEPDILIVDEALSVGDMRFQQKCFRKIEELKQNKTVLFVSHDMATVVNYCDRVIWLDNGNVIDVGHPKEIAKEYQAFMLGSKMFKSTGLDPIGSLESIKDDDIDDLPDNLDVIGDNKVQILGISMYDHRTNEKNSMFSPLETVKIIIKVKSIENIKDPIVGFTLKDRIGNIICQCNTYVMQKQVPELKPLDIVSYCFKLTLPSLNKGAYTLTPALASGSQEDHIQHCLVHDAYIFNIINNKRYSLQGLLNLDDVEFNQI